MQNQNRTSEYLKKIIGIALFAALAYAATFVFRIPVQFLTFDAKDAILTVGAFVFGPIAAVIMPLVPALIELISISDTGPLGFVMNYASSLTFTLTAALIYRFRRSLNGAIISLYVAVGATVIVMTGMNILITPIYMKVPREVVLNLLPSLLMPFNFAKALMNAAIVMLVYKPVSVALKRTGIVKGQGSLAFTRGSVIMLIVGAVTLVLAAVVFIVLKTQ